ncbi:MAG: DegV family protein, partial [Pisciglobus halotolerans]|nr:DegV family protein [Pisciglobus halotolerans]
MTRLIVDSGCDTDEKMAKNYRYEVVPLSISLKEHIYLDGLEISVDEVYDAMRQGIVPKTSQISYKSMVEALEKCIEDGEDAIYLALSSGLSGTYNLGRQVIETYQKKYPNKKFAAVDSKGGAGGETMIALRALEMMKRQLPFEEIVEFMHWSTEHIEYRFTLSNLSWLVKGGRLPNTAAKIGTALNIYPYLGLNKGKIKLLKLFRGEKKVYRRMMSDVKEATASFTDQMIVVSHAGDREGAEKTAAELQEIRPDATIRIFKISAVLGTHLGIGGVGVFFYNDKPKE